ncbi:MAG: hypothetical protein AB9897_03030 [Anaerolineaceae bacterium]
MLNVCGNCGNSISDPDSDWPEVQCSHCGAYNEIVPDFVRKNPGNNANRTFGEYLNYPSLLSIDSFSNNQKQFEKIIKDRPVFFSGNGLFQALDFVYQVNSDRACEWLGWVTDTSSHFPSNVIAMEILGNMNSIKALQSIINNLSFGYLSENLKGDLPGGGLFHQVIQTISTNSANKYSDLTFCELATAPFIPDKIICVVPELIRKVQIELFRLEKTADIVRRLGLQTLNTLWPLASTRDKGKNQNIGNYLALLNLSFDRTDNSIFTIISNRISAPIKKNDDIVALILTGDKIIGFSKRNPDNTTYHGLIQSLLAHKEPRVKVCAACSILYQDLKVFTQIALDSSIVYRPMMINAIKHSALLHDNQTL